MDVCEIIEKQYKPFARYVVESRALPKLSDGLKPVERRSLWIARKVAKEWAKVSKLAGAVMSLHPHGNTAIEASISSMVQKFPGTNNITLFDGDGIFGCRINGPGNGIASPRYVSVKLSKEYYDIFSVDDNLINMVPNYDETDKEPNSFMPLIPFVLVNPIEGIAVGFSCNILPRKISDIKKAQIDYLNGKNIKPLMPYYEGFTGSVVKGETENQWLIYGTWSYENNILSITDLPVGMNREQYVSLLEKLEEKEIIKTYEDNCSDKFNFKIVLNKEFSREDLISTFKLCKSVYENITIIGVNGEILEKITDVELIKYFTDWRFTFFTNRYEELNNTLNKDLLFDKSLLKVIESGIFKKFINMKKDEIILSLREMDILDDNIKKIMNIPIYKFSKDEVEVLKNKIKENTQKINYNNEIINSKEKRISIYINELKGL